MFVMSHSTKTREVESPPAPVKTTFPLRVGCVDAGSNAIRFVVAEFTDRHRSTVLAAERVPVRLGHGVFLTGKLSARAMDEAVAALSGFRRTMEGLDVVAYRAVATSAVREASNREAFLNRVKKESGLELDVITGSEEARLVHLAIRNRVALGREQWVLVDLGGGSVEVSLVDDSGILWSESHTMGSVRLLEELAGADDDPGRFRRVLSEYVATLRVPSAARHRKPHGVIATGGNIESLAGLAGMERDGNGVSVVHLADLRRVIETLARLSYRRRVEELDLREDRADVILPAALVYARLAELAGASRVIVPHVGVKDGVLLDVIDALTSQQSHEERREREVFDAAVNLGRRYLFDEDHAVHVAALARELFDQLRELHGLAPENRRVLVAAALLHDVGAFISYKKHHRHSFYVISNSEINGLSPGETVLAAHVARYHRKSDPGLDHELFARLGEKDRARVVGMAAILRMADALDREHRQLVRGVRARTKGGEVVLKPLVDEDILLERWSLGKRAQLFEKTFGVEVRVRPEREA
jgi:exopolyphosphatase/guanosine-5'-triphosphate,3'-diphosphate pyrophosphatase